MKEIRGYSSPFNLGHRAISELFDGRILVQEKIDGSQFSFGIRDGELFCRSRNQMIYLDKPDMFKLAVETAKDLYDQGLLQEGWTYRGEFLMKPKHNTLVYDRVPRGNIILFDIDQGDQSYLELEAFIRTAIALDLEHVASWYIEIKPSVEDLEKWMTEKSALGNCKIEGVVFKNYAKYGPDSKVLMGKYVSEKFREKHGKGWKDRHPGAKAFVAILTERYATEGRWYKAVHHLREAGTLQGEMRDIPQLLEEINRDVLEECKAEIQETLFKHFWKQMSRGLTKGMPEWYKELLAEEMLNTE